MATLTPADLLERFPELGSAPPAVVSAALATAERLTAEQVWQDVHEDGVAFYAAHLITLRIRQVGATVNQPVAGPGADRALSSTFYGQQYEDLMLTLPLTGFVA
jgi:hypothetical protein